MLSKHPLQPVKHSSSVLARQRDDRFRNGRRARVLDARRDSGRALLERARDGLVVPEVGSLVLDGRVHDVEGFVSR